MRDILTLHYVDVSAEAVFNTCREKIGPLSEVISTIIRDMQKP